MQSLSHTFKRYRTLQTHRISALPIAILMPHSACNCRCVMCDIWKDNKNLKQLTERDISGLLASFQKLGTSQVVMSGGEALLNPHFFELCKILKKQGLKISLLSTGLTLKTHANELVRCVDDIIVSIDGDEFLHDAIRNIPGAFQRLKAGIAEIKDLNPGFRISARTVIHRLNFRNWLQIINAAKSLQINQISFLPADVSSNAFNRPLTWEEPRQNEILIGREELPELKEVISAVISYAELNPGFIAESAERLDNIYRYYAAFYGLNNFPYKTCNAPWVSAVVEPDGSVLPCFFHESIGNIRTQNLSEIINSPNAIAFRKSLKTSSNATCERCVCSLNLHPATDITRQYA